MRVSTSSYFESGTNALLRAQAELVKTQQQMSTGRRILTAADDPSGASNALRVAQSLGRNEQLRANQTAASNSLAVAESTLGHVGELLQGAQERLLQAQNGTLSAVDRQTIAGDIDALLGQLTGLANARDVTGAYLFAGYSESSKPFENGAGGVTYQGDDGSRKLEAASGRLVGISASGSDIFMRIKNGNGVFSTGANSANSGSGFIDSGSVSDPSALTGRAYSLTFNVSAGIATYDVYDTTAGASVSTGNPFRAGQSIAVAGMQVGINGTPAAGDVFSLSPAVNQSVFKTLADASAALRSGAAAGARLTTVNNALSGLMQATDHILTMRADFGSRMNELAAYENVSGAVVLEHQKRLSELQDLDYTEAATRLMRQQTSHEAAQQSFAKIAKLSLFNYIG